MRPGARQGGLQQITANLPTNIVDFKGCDSSRILIFRNGIFMTGHVHREFSGKFESSNASRNNVSRDHVSREIGRRTPLHIITLVFSARHRSKNLGFVLRSLSPYAIAYMYISLSLYIYIYIYIHTYTVCVCIYIYIHTYIHIYIHMHICTHNNKK